MTGGAGFIGSHLCLALVENGHTVYSVDDESGGDFRNLDADSAHRIERITLNCRDRQAVESFFREYSQYGPIDCLVHCAANAREGASQFQPRSVTERNMLAFVNVLVAAIAWGCKRTVLFSSMSVYGRGAPPFDESDPLNPCDVYAVNKVAMEQTLHILAQVHGLTYCVIRPHNVFGELQTLQDKMRNVVAIFMNRIMRAEPLFIYGDGKQTRSFSYIGDSLPCFVRAVEDTSRLNGHAINVGGMHPIAIDELANAVKRAMGVSEHYPTEYFDERPCEVKNAYTTYAKSKRLLDYEETVGWERGVVRMAEWARRMGPQPWAAADALELVTKKTPIPWTTR